MERYHIKSTFTVEKEFMIVAKSKEEAEKMVRNLDVPRPRESTVTRVRINSVEEAS